MDLATKLADASGTEYIEGLKKAMTRLAERPGMLATGVGVAALAGTVSILSHNASKYGLRLTTIRSSGFPDSILFQGTPPLPRSSLWKGPPGTIERNGVRQIPRMALRPRSQIWEPGCHPRTHDAHPLHLRPGGTAQDLSDE